MTAACDIAKNGGVTREASEIAFFGGSFTAVDRDYMVSLLEAAKPSFKDYKTILQEVVQKNQGESLKYVLVSESGPDHDKHFKVEVHLNSNVIGAGVGSSKKKAEQAAAKEALELMGI